MTRNVQESGSWSHTRRMESSTDVGGVQSVTELSYCIAEFVVITVLSLLVCWRLNILFAQFISTSPVWRCFWSGDPRRTPGLVEKL